MSVTTLEVTEKERESETDRQTDRQTKTTGPCFLGDKNPNVSYNT